MLLDASAVWRVNGNVRLSLTANNLLNSGTYQYISYGTLSRSEHHFESGKEASLPPSNTDSKMTKATVYGNEADCFIVRLNNGKQYVLGCDNPDSIVNYTITSGIPREAFAIGNR